MLKVKKDIKYIQFIIVVTDSERIKNLENESMKLQQEVSDFKCKLINKESMKNNLSMILKQKNVKNEELKTELVNFINVFEKAAEEIKWNKDKLIQKDIQIKTYKEKLNKLTVENEANLKIIEKLKKIKNVQDIKVEPIQTEELIPLTPKPFLFQDFSY